jgi:hypothetical protein
MPLVGFELTLPAFERDKTYHAIDRAATVIAFLQKKKKNAWQQCRGTRCIAAKTCCVWRRVAQTKTASSHSREIQLLSSLLLPVINSQGQHEALTLWTGNSAIVTRSYDLYECNKSSYQPTETPSTVAHTRDNIYTVRCSGNSKLRKIYIYIY